MKRALVALFFLFLAIPGRSADPIGALKHVTGVVYAVNVDGNSVNISGVDYQVDTGSMLVINGRSGSLKDLAVGMKVDGTATTTRGGPAARMGDRIVQTQSGGMVIRMLNAAVDPNAPPPVVPAAAPAPWMQGAVQPGSPTDVKAKLNGTFWMLVDEKNPQAQNWFSLNENGTTTCSWATVPGRWLANMGNVMASFGTSAMTMIRLSGDFSQGQIFDRDTSSKVTITRVATPTQAMQEKVATAMNASGIPGTANALPVPAASVAPTPAPASPDIQTTAAEIVRANHANLVFVTGKEGAGSGFIANMGNGTFLVTNAHVAAGISDAGFKTLTGDAVTGGAPCIAVGHDIFCMAMPAGVGTPLEVMQKVDENAKIGDDVVVLGNAEGSGVVNTILGKIVGIGPNLVEIDAQFVPGNSGSPIIHVKSGKVIGVATYLVVKKYDAATHEKMAQPEIRRYGYRLDSVKTWQPVDWRSFYVQADTMEKIHGLTDDLDGFFRDIVEHKGRITVERHTNPVIKNRISQWIEDKQGHKSAFDLENADANFLSFLKVACQSDITAAQNRLSYDYFQRELTDEQQVRTEMAKAFSDIIKDIRE